MTASLLEVRNARVGYGLAEVLHDFNLAVGQGEAVSLLGPNGAGKTTALLSIVGRLHPVAGKIEFSDREITKLSTHRIAQLGIGMLPDDRALLSSLTVGETFSLIRQKSDIDPLAVFPELEPLQGRRCGLLSGGEQQMVGLARAIAAMPKLLIIDELSQALAPLVVQRLMAAVRQVVDEHGMSLLVVEQHVKAVLEISDRAYVLVAGRVRHEGEASVLLSELDTIEKTYMGDET